MLVRSIEDDAMVDGIIIISANKFALLWGEAQKKIAYSYPKLT